MNYFVRNLQCAGCMAAAVSFTIGMIGMVGWLSYKPHLFQVNPDSVPMQFNTSLGMVLGGIGFFVLHLKCFRTASYTGFLIWALGFATQLQYMTGADLGIDDLFIEHYVTNHTVSPGRMAPNSALAFTMIGMALAFCDSRVALFFGGAVALLFGVFGVIGHLTGITPFYAWESSTQISMNAGVAFSFMGWALIRHASNIGK